MNLQIGDIIGFKDTYEGTRETLLLLKKIEMRSHIRDDSFWTTLSLDNGQYKDRYIRNDLYVVIKVLA